MSYFLNTYRIPKPGQFTAVVNGVTESLKATGRGGFVNIPVSPRMPGAQSMSVIATVGGFETLDDVDAFYDGLLADNMAGFAARDELGSMCDHFNLSVSRRLTDQAPLQGFEPKIISRNFAVAKPGKGPELIELVLEWGEELDFRGSFVVSVQLGGQVGAIRVAYIVESLQALEDLNKQVAASPRVQKLVELINGPIMRGVGRITYINRP